MKCVVVSEKKQARVISGDVPEPGTGEVLVEMVECGICGSDLHAWHGQWADDYRLGHEYCGVVTEVGDGVENLEPGMRVTGECFGHCGECVPCLSGHYNHCENIEWNPSRPEGALSEKFCYRAEAVFPVPHALTDRQAALVEPTAVALHALDRGGVGLADNIVIIGAGTIGLLCVAIANVLGLNQVVSIAKYDHQADMADEMGATDVVRQGEENPREVVPDVMGEQGADASIDTVAVGTSFSTGLALTRPRGTMVEVGGVTRPLLAALDPLVGGEIDIRGSSCYAASTGETDFDRAIELISDGAIEPEKLVTHVFALEEVQKAFETADDKESGAIKVIVEG